LVAEQLKDGDAVWLKDQNQEFLNILQRDRTGNQSGLVVILHDQGGHPNSPGVAHYLRTELTNHGWDTLSVAMPHYDDLVTNWHYGPMVEPVIVEEQLPPSQLSTNEKADEAGDESEEAANASEQQPAEDKATPEPPKEPATPEDTPDTAAATTETDPSLQFLPKVDISQRMASFQSRETLEKAYQQQLSQRWKTIQPYIDSLGAESVVFISYGLSTYWLMQIHESSGIKLDKMIIVSAYGPTAQDNTLLSTRLNNGSVPLLDIYAEDDFTLVLTGANSRRELARRTQKENYRQAIMRGTNHRYYQKLPDLLRLIRGWLSPTRLRI
jgi:hypothetical protein